MDKNRFWFGEVLKSEPRIYDVHSREILDSRGNPTIEVDVILDTEHCGRFQVPSGASTGKFEALELRDGDKKRFNGKGVLKAVENVNNIIAKKLIGLSAFNQVLIDNTMIELDGTKNKSKLGANAILGVSVATAKACANYLNIPFFRYIGGVNSYLLPTPLMNVLNGGKHADNNLDIQEFMIVPVKAKSFSQSYRMAAEVFHKLKSILQSESHCISVGDEGGFAPNLKSNEEGLKYLIKAIEEAGYKPGEDFLLAIDAAASEFYNKEKNKYILKSENKELDYKGMVEYYKELVEKYPIISIEDGLAEDDWEGWKYLTEQLGNKVQIVGDDLFVTNIERICRGISEKVANSVLIKLNQIGTLTETLGAIEMARNSGYTTIISHRSGETADTAIAHIAVGLNLGQIKTGSVSRIDRVEKYNELLRIEEVLGATAIYGGKSVFK